MRSATGTEADSQAFVGTGQKMEHEDKETVVIAVSILASTVIGTGPVRAQALTQPEAQALLSEIQSLQASENLSTMVQAVETTTPAAADSVPFGTMAGTYYSAWYLVAAVAR